MREQGLGIRSAVAAVVLAAVVLAGPRAVTGAAAATNAALWFAPSPGSSDYLQLFEDPQAWARARELISVFKFYQQHTQTPAPSIVGPNTYDALARAGAFRLVNQWHKKIALEVGSVKEFFCTADASGMNASISGTLASIAAVKSAGGAVAYLAMDEPFVSGRSRTCGGPALEPTADRVATYVTAVRKANPDVAIGLIEAYPFSSADAIEAIV